MACSYLSKNLAGDGPRPLRRASGRYAVRDTTIKHRSRVAQDALECGAIWLCNRFGVASSLHGSTDDNVAVTAEHVHDSPIPAAAAEEIELFGQRLSQHHEMPAFCDDPVVVHQRFGTVTSAIDDDVFSQFREIVFAFEFSPAKSHGVSPQVSDELRQQDCRIDQPSPVFATRHVESAEGKRARPVLRHHVEGRAVIVCGISMVQCVVSSERDAIKVPSR